jgi:hypothetical protein
MLLGAWSVFADGSSDEGFTTLFDGKSLEGWKLIDKKGDGYVVKDGVLVCPADGGGRLFVDKQYANFILRFDFKNSPGGNNGVGLRAPLKGDPAYVGMEIQILDDDAPVYAKLQPYQYCGSVYGVAAAKRGALHKAGEWNSEEIVCDGRRVKVTLNGQVIVDANLDDVKDPAVLKTHPGLARKEGYVGFLGHSSLVEFRNIRIKELP